MTKRKHRKEARRQRRKEARNPSTRKVAVEQLESRCLLAAVADFDSMTGALSIEAFGTEANYIVVSVDSGFVKVTDDGVDILTAAVDPSDVAHLYVDLAGGGDSLHTNAVTPANGFDGNAGVSNYIYMGDGNDTVTASPLFLTIRSTAETGMTRSTVGAEWMKSGATTATTASWGMTIATF